MKNTIHERFWSKVAFIPEHTCWEWIGCKHLTKGYGRIRYNKNGKWVTCYSHRISWEIHIGSIPSGLNVLHKCDNTSCVRPEHLFLGTQDENMKDMVSKGRQNKAKGENVWIAKLKPADVLEIRRLYKQGVLQKDIAKQFNIHRGNVSMIVIRKTWRHI